KDIRLELRILDAVVAADQRHDLAAVEGLVDLGRDLLRQVLRHEAVGIAFEEERRRDLQRLRYVVEPARRDANVAGLVFLNGLEGDADLRSERSLAQSELDAAQSH